MQVYIASQAGRSAKGRPYLFLTPEIFMAQPLMPHATAAWLVDNSSLTFEQIAEFCGLHILEVQAIADDTAATKLTGRDPLPYGIEPNRPVLEELLRAAAEQGILTRPVDLEQVFAAETRDRTA